MQNSQPVEVGSRIAVWGVTGSGKTTFAKKLGEMLGLGVVELDAIRHASGWDSTDFDDFRRILTSRLDSMSDGWVCEGSYHQIMDVYLSRIDTMIWLHLPFRLSFWRLLKRTLARAIDQQPLYNPDGPHESWRQSFFDRRSILWWSISMHRSSTRARRERIAQLATSVRVYELRSAGEVTAFLRDIERAGQAEPA